MSASETIRKNGEEYFERTVVFYREEDEASGFAVLSCAHAVTKVGPQPQSEVGRKVFCSQCVNYLVKNKRELPQAYRLQVTGDACKCCGSSIEVIGPMGPMGYHVRTRDITEESIANCVHDLNEAYGLGYLGRDREITRAQRPHTEHA